MRILHVISSNGVYGAERVIINLRGALPEIEMHIALFAKANGSHEPMQRAMRSLGVEVILLDDATFAPANAIRRLRELVAQRKINIVQAHGYKGNVLATIALKDDLSTALVCMEHGFTDKSAKSKLYGVIDRYALKAKSVRRIVCVSDNVRARCLAAGAPGGKIVKIPNAAPLADNVVSDYQQRDIDLLYLGRLSIEKGADLFIDALAQLEKPTPIAVIAGDGADRSALESRAQRLGVTGAVRFVGYCADPASLFRRAKWFVLPSRTEGAPLSLLEAFACGTPAIASNVGEVSALYDREKFGFLIEPGEAKLLASALREASSFDPEHWINFSGGALSLATGEYSFENWGRLWRTLYKEVAEHGIAA